MFLPSLDGHIVYETGARAIVNMLNPLFHISRTADMCIVPVSYKSVDFYSLPSLNHSLFLVKDGKKPLLRLQPQS
jgi:hypothetical protein